jgi:hypothetical protein
VAGDDPAVGVHEDRIREPELADARGDLRDLLLGVRPGVPGARNKAGNGLIAWRSSAARSRISLRRWRHSTMATGLVPCGQGPNRQNLRTWGLPRCRWLTKD